MKILRFISFLLLPATTGFAQIAEPIVHLDSNRTGALFEIRNPVPQLDTLQAGTQRYIRPVFPAQAGLAIVNGRDIPVMTAVLAIPPVNAVPVVSVLEETWQPLVTSLKLAPHLALRKDSTLDFFEFSRGQQDNQPWPAAITLSRTGWFRHLRVAHVRIIPIREKEGRIEYLQRATVRLRWPDARVPDGAAGIAPLQVSLLPDEQSLYQQAVLNDADIPRFVQQRRVLTKAAGIRAGEAYLIFKIREDGVYRIDGESIRANGVDLASIDPAELRMYNNGGKPLPERLSQARPDTLIEIPIIVDDGGDGRIDPSDAVYFYGAGLTWWAFDTLSGSWQHSDNPYSRENAYWLSWHSRPGPARRFTALAIGAGGSAPVASATQFRKIENEIHNPINSGRDWYGKEFSVVDNKATYAISFQNPPATAGGMVRLKIVSKTLGTHEVTAIWNGQVLGKISFFGSTSGDYLSLGQRTRSFSIPAGLIHAENTLELDYRSSAAFGRAYIDWVEVVAEDRLVAADGKIVFGAGRENKVQQFRISGLADDIRIFEVSDPLNPRFFAFERSGADVLFTDSLSLARAGLYFATSSVLTPVASEKYTTVNLRAPERGADILLITHETFLQEAERFAEHKRSVDGFEVEVVNFKDVAAEFGWGIPDPTAIRDFVAHAFHFWRKAPSYVILFGDATYDYRDVGKGILKNWIPNFQTTELDELVNRNIEAYFVYINGDDRDMDLAIGRIPAQTPEDARSFVDKIIQYETAPEYGIWRTLVTMVADDELITGGVERSGETIHVIDTERIAEDFIPDYMNLRKIYLMEYRATRTASISGIRKPGAEQDLIDQINSGSLIVNYVGHGNSSQWTHEVIFEQAQDFPKIHNGNRLTFIMAATCDFGRYDKLNAQSFPEDLLFAPNRGIIGIVTSSRVVYASPNASFNRQYYRALFGDNLASRSIGQSLMLARLQTTNLTNDEKYTILGDPSLKLAIPTRPAEIAQLAPDSLFALSKTRIQGSIDPAGATPPAAGQIELLVFDDVKQTSYRTSRNLLVNYRLPGNLLFRGTGTLQNSRFDMSFIVPKDVTYGGANGRVSVYGFGENWEAVGYRETIPISLRSSILFDDRGPAISIGFADRENFANGDPIPQQATLMATITDSISGINVTGEIGHKITLKIDGDTESRLDLTANFIYFPNDFLGGQLKMVLPDLPLGRHTAELKAWDNSNNSTTAFIEFILTEKDRLNLSEVMNYPNPFSEQTSFTFILNTEAEVKISIYTVAGRLIRRMEDILASPGFNQVQWDGRDADGDRLANGVYLYRIEAKSLLDGTPKTAEYIGKVAFQK